MEGQLFSSLLFICVFMSQQKYVDFLVIVLLNNLFTVILLGKNITLIKIMKKYLHWLS